MKSKSFLEISGIALLLAIVVVGYRLAPDLMSRGEVVLPVSACDPGRMSCRASLPDGTSLQLQFSPQPVPLMKPFQIEIELQGISARQLEVDFNAVGMDMGYNRPRLAADGQGRYVASTSLPVCVTGPMEWQATVMIETLTARIAVPFRFSTS